MSVTLKHRAVPQWPNEYGKISWIGLVGQLVWVSCMVGALVYFLFGTGERLPLVLLGAVWFLAAIGFLGGTASGIVVSMRSAARYRGKESLLGAMSPYAMVVVLIGSAVIFATAIHKLNSPDDGQAQFAIGLIIVAALSFLAAVQFVVVAIARWSVVNLLEIAEERKELTTGLERP